MSAPKSSSPPPQGGPPEAGAKPSVGDERYRLLVESVKDYAIFMLDADARVQTWNPGAEAAKGYTASEILGRHISTFYTPEDRAAGRPAMLIGRAIREGRVEDEGWRVRKDGTYFWADVVITPMRNEHGDLIGFSKVTRDLTARRQTEEALRQSEERFRVLVQSVHDYAIFMLDPQGKVATWNLGAERIKQYSPEEIIGQHFSRFYLPDEVARGKCGRALETALQKGKFEDEGWRVRKDGTRFWASVVIEPLHDATGKLLGFAKVTRDLTERRAADDERIRLAQAEEAVRLRDEFLSIASHELKTPLSAVQLQLQGLLYGAQALDPKTRERAERAYRGGERLADLVEALLDVSRIATGRFTLHPTLFDLCEIVDDVAERFSEHAAREGGRFEVRNEGPVLGRWDRLRVEQVLTNLISNSLKYAPGTTIELGASREGDTATLYVSDVGPGIPASERARVFGRFERAVSMLNYGGLGLGLYVAREISSAHHGTIHIESVHPHGTRIVLKLPVNALPLETPPPEEEE